MPEDSLGYALTTSVQRRSPRMFDILAYAHHAFDSVISALRQAVANLQITLPEDQPMHVQERLRNSRWKGRVVSSRRCHGDVYTVRGFSLSDCIAK